MRVNLGEEELGVNMIKIYCMYMYEFLLKLMKILYLKSEEEARQW